MGTSQVRGRTVPQREDEWKYGYMGVWWREYNPKKNQKSDVLVGL